MRIKVLAFASSLLLVSNCSAAIPQTLTTQSSAQAATVLIQSLKALTGSSFVTDVTLTGTAERIAGSDDDTGTATYKAVANVNRLDLNLSSGTRSEIWNTSAVVPTGAWVGPDGVSHSVPYHNLLTDPGWFPHFALANMNSSPNSVITYVGVETLNGVSVIHLSASQQLPSFQGSSATLLQHLTQVDIYLDSTTFLPVSFVFNMHPDVDAARDIPAEIRYSNFQTVGGVKIPFHLQKFVNNSLILDLQFQNASLNTGITAAQIAAQ